MRERRYSRPQQRVIDVESGESVRTAMFRYRGHEPFQNIAALGVQIFYVGGFRFGTCAWE